jgi:hypothetical protein
MDLKPTLRIIKKLKINAGKANTKPQGQVGAFSFLPIAKPA